MEDASPVRSITPFGTRQAGAEGGPEALLALGGGPEEHPDGISVVPLPPGGGEDEGGEEEAGEVVRLKWVGHVLGLALVPPPGSITLGENSTRNQVLYETKVVSTC